MLINSNLKIRSANIKDVPTILSMIKNLAEYEKLSHEVAADEARLEATLFGEKARAEVILGELDSKPVAFALFFHNYSTFLAKPGIYLEDLFVHPEARGHGIGQRMLEHIARLALDRGCGRFEWSVLDWNTDAIRFYEKLGAKAMNEWTVFRLDGPSLEKLGSNVHRENKKS